MTLAGVVASRQRRCGAMKRKRRLLPRWRTAMRSTSSIIFPRNGMGDDLEMSPRQTVSKMQLNARKGAKRERDTWMRACPAVLVKENYRREQGRKRKADARMSCKVMSQHGGGYR